MRADTTFDKETAGSTSNVETADVQGVVETGGSAFGAFVAVSTDDRLLESGDFRLLENGDRRIVG